MIVEYLTMQCNQKGSQLPRFYQIHISSDYQVVWSNFRIVLSLLLHVPTDRVSRSAKQLLNFPCTAIPGHWHNEKETWPTENRAVSGMGWQRGKNSCELLTTETARMEKNSERWIERRRWKVRKFVEARPSPTSYTEGRKWRTESRLSWSSCGA